jgi:SNF2 family DNA or RNA helicase
VFDLDLFSERVVELGFYKPTFYPFISPYESEWVPGFVVETSPEERKQVRFDTEDDLDAFEEALETAKAQGDQEVSWNDIDVPIGEAERITETARRQFEEPETPVTDRSDDGESAQDQVLIIRTNVEDEEFSEVPGAPSLESFEHAYQPPPHLKESYSPREHQKTGIAWMQSLFAEQYPGGLLADDMGLGKTFQVLSYIKWHRSHRNPGEKPYLIVAPVALLENWENEYHKFYEPSPPPVQILHGKVLRDCVHGDVEAHWRKGADRLSGGGMYITTYGSLRRYQLLFGAVDWAAVILDEAQRIKNPSTQVTSAAKALKADFKLPMTGTPVENSLVDLWCLVDFAVPGLLGSAKEFAKTYQNPLRDEDTDVQQLGEQLRGELGVYLKRRLKSQVIDELPDKEVHRSQEPMPKIQHERYHLEIEQAREAKASGEDGGQAVLKALHAMRIISDHPYLPDRSVDRVSVDDLIPTSAKLAQTVDILRSVRDRGEKAILFADRKVTQRMLAKVLRERFGTETRVINGDTPAGKTSSASRQTRQQIIDDFGEQDGFGALVMSPIAAGLGLNITAANHVIHYARHWNPAKEDQATDRVYRIGQEKKVHVYYPMCTIPEEPYPSFDQILDDLLERKRALADASLFPSQRVEVRPDDLYSSVLDSEVDGEAPSGSTVDVKTACSLDPYLFEALVALLWKNEGCQVYLTPKQSDRGADVVALTGESGTLIQVKQQQGTVGTSPVREVYSAKPFYESKFGTAFDELIVVTSASRYTRGAQEMARDNGVILLSRADLAEQVKRYEPTMRRVHQQERKRMDKL